MLIVALDASRKEPLYEQIYNSIKEEIVTGALPFGQGFLLQEDLQNIWM